MDQDEALWARRSASFGASARAYADHRPDYATAAIRWALGDARDVLDVGAGTGALTGGLVRAAANVTAVEPDEAMLAELRARVPGAQAVIGSAEELPVADNSTDLITAGTAFHWFDLDRALTEFRRVLRPGGRVALFYDLDDVERAPWLKGLNDAKRTSASTPPPHDGPDWTPPAHDLLGPWEQQRFAHTHRRTAESLTATIGTQSHTLVVSEEERAEALQRVRGFLSEQPETRDGEFDVPLWTVVAVSELRAGRRP